MTTVEKIHSEVDSAQSKSHFKKGYFVQRQFEVKDPIVFQYCKNGFLRIETKWGAEAKEYSLMLPIIN